jgi:N-acetylglucosamine kinase-like BadF-type ATPase
VKVALAVDGGNSKTDVAVVSADGNVLGFARGRASSPHHIGVEGTVEIVAELIEEALGSPPQGRVADVAALLMAGVDFPAEEDEVRAAVAARGWADEISVGNDTFAVLRAGTERGWGVAVVCGAGINCVGVAPDGRHARFPALGATTGDWGGGFDVGLAATSAAARSEDGRGPTTSLERLVPAHFGVRTPLELAEEIHRGSIPMSRLEELPPVVFAAAAAADAVAVQIVDRLASEVVALSRVALERLDLTEQPVELLLGGGLLQAGDGRLLDRIEAGMREVGTEITVRRSSSPPIVGAVLLALDAIGAPPEAQGRARHQVGHAAGGAERMPVG